MALHWDQRSCHLICAGDSKVVKIWDIETETTLTSISTGVNASVTCLSMQLKGKLQLFQMNKEYEGRDFLMQSQIQINVKWVDHK